MTIALRRGSNSGPHNKRRPVSEVEVLALGDPLFMTKFHSQITRSGDGCWAWEGSKRKSGAEHGIISYLDHTLYAHRISYLAHKGPIPAGMIVCHTCDDGLCPNPAHLYAGTYRSNFDDSVSRGRSLGHPPPMRNSANPKAVLTNEQVAELRRLYATEKVPQRSLARSFKCSQSTVGRIVNFLTREIED